MTVAVTDAKTYTLSRPGGRAYTLQLRLHPQRIEIGACGELDLCAADDLRRLLNSVAGLTVPVWCDLSEVTFLDTAALTPFVDATRERSTTDYPIYLHPRSDVVQRLIGLHGLGDRDILDLATWDAPGDAHASLGSHLSTGAFGL